jgi:hypothetical protein
MALSRQWEASKSRTGCARRRVNARKKAWGLFVQQTKFDPGETKRSVSLRSTSAWSLQKKAWGLVRHKEPV